MYKKFEQPEIYFNLDYFTFITQIFSISDS